MVASFRMAATIAGFADDREDTRIPVGASLLAMVVNDNATELIQRGVLESIASKLAPTGGRIQ